MLSFITRSLSSQLFRVSAAAKRLRFKNRGAFIWAPANATILAFVAFEGAASDSRLVKVEAISVVGQSAGWAPKLDDAVESAQYRFVYYTQVINCQDRQALIVPHTL